MRMLINLLFFILLIYYFRCCDTNKLDSFIMDIESSEKLKKTPVDLMTNISENLYIEQNNNLILSCTANGDYIYVTLMKDEKELDRNFIKDGTRKVTAEYRKKNINCYDAGKYKCRSGNKFGIQEITRTIIVKCPVLPSRFISNNVNLMTGSSDFKFICDKHKDVNQAVPYVVSIRSMYGKTLNSTNVMSTTNFTFSYVKCEDMGTYRCETRTQTSNHSTETDLFVHYCPPLLTHTEETVEVDIGNSLYFTINATMSEKMHTLNVMYQTYSQTYNKCGHKLCVMKFTINKWLKQINITVKNITQQDFGNQTVKFCSENDKVNYCSDFYLNIVPKQDYIMTDLTDLPPSDEIKLDIISLETTTSSMSDRQTLTFTEERKCPDNTVHVTVIVCVVTLLIHLTIVFIRSLVTFQKKNRTQLRNEQKFSSRNYNLSSTHNTAGEPVILLNVGNESSEYSNCSPYNCPPQLLYSNIDHFKDSERFVPKAGLKYVTIDHSQINRQQHQRIPAGQAVTYTTVKI